MCINVTTGHVRPPTDFILIFWLHLGHFFSLRFDTSFDTFESFMHVHVFMNTKVGRFTAADHRNHFAVNKFKRFKKAISAWKRAEASLIPGNIPEVFWHSEERRGHERRQKKKKKKTASANSHSWLKHDYDIKFTQQRVWIVSLIDSPRPSCTGVTWLTVRAERCVHSRNTGEWHTEIKP